MTTVAFGLVACNDDSDPPTTAQGKAGTEAAPLPVARTEVAGASLQGMVAAVGGLTLDGAASDRVDLYDPAADAWRTGPALPVPLHHVGLATLGDRLYVAGGYTNLPDGSWEAQAAVRSLGPGEQQWRDEPSLASPRGALGLVAGSGRLVAVGGVLGGNGGLTSRVEVLVPGQPGWQPGPDLAEPRQHLAVAASGERAWAIGGRLGDLSTNLTSVESWNPEEPGGWRAEPALNDSRGGTSATEVGGKPCVAGGEEPGATIASVECLVGGRWERVAQLDTPRHGLAVAAIGSELHVVGGGPQPGLSVSAAHEVFDLG